MEARSHEFYSLNLHYIWLLRFAGVKTPNSYNTVYVDVNPVLLPICLVAPRLLYFNPPLIIF